MFVVAQEGAPASALFIQLCRLVSQSIVKIYPRFKAPHLFDPMYSLEINFGAEIYRKCDFQLIQILAKLSLAGRNISMSYPDNLRIFHQLLSLPPGGWKNYLPAHSKEYNHLLLKFLHAIIPQYLFI